MAASISCKDAILLAVTVRGLRNAIVYCQERGWDAATIVRVATSPDYVKRNAIPARTKAFNVALRQANAMNAKARREMLAKFDIARSAIRGTALERRNSR